MKSRLYFSLTLLALQVFGAGSLAVIGVNSSPGHQTVASQLPQNPKSGTVWVNPKDGAEMVFVPAGEFEMGSEDFKGSKPVHKVVLDGYYIDRTSVTVGQYLKFCDETGHKKPVAPEFNPNWSKKNHPVVNVSYLDAQAYCEWSGTKLPTEAQWEKAAAWDDAGKKKRKFPWGDEYDGKKFWRWIASDGEENGTRPVGSFPAGESPYGLLDMAGNVWNWCNDWYDEGFYGDKTGSVRNAENQSVGEKKERVVRGGSWYRGKTFYVNSAARGFNTPEYSRDDCGFRCVAGQK